jgi:phenylpropionate dioxygenase-like ring-hydroxylating dioxygenase large terminal subunit
VRPLDADAYLQEATYRSTRLPVSHASTLIPDAYTELAFYRLEQNRVFATAWVAVAVTDAVASPGDAVVTRVGERSIIVTRNREGRLRGFHNVCRHRGSELLDEGPCHVGRHIRCPYHSWAYDLDGRLLGTPLFTPDVPVPHDQRGIFDMHDVEQFRREDYGLHPVSVAAWGPLVFANLNLDPDPLESQLGDLPERLAGYRLDEWRTARSATYEIAANYKLVAENFMEYYHLPWVHPGLVKVSPMKAHHRWQGTGMYTGMCTRPIAANTDRGGWQGLPPLQGLSDEDATSARFVWLFPNAALNVLPNHLFVMLARPAGPDRTVEDVYLLIHPDSRDSRGYEQRVDELAAFWDEVNREDIAIVERVQRGLANPAYTGGRMCYRFEEPLHRFQNMVIDRMVGVRRVPKGDGVAERPMFGT